MALQYARGEIRLGRAMTIESLIGSRFVGRVVEETTVGPHPAVIPEVKESAYVTGTHTFLIDPDGPLEDGFILCWERSRARLRWWQGHAALTRSSRDVRPSRIPRRTAPTADPLREGCARR